MAYIAKPMHNVKHLKYLDMDGRPGQGSRLVETAFQRVKNDENRVRVRCYGLQSKYRSGDLNRSRERELTRSTERCAPTRAGLSQPARFALRYA
jgi:hypothetical protein